MFKDFLLQPRVIQVGKAPSQAFPTFVPVRSGNSAIRKATAISMGLVEIGTLLVPNQVPLSAKIDIHILKVLTILEITRLCSHIDCFSLGSNGRNIYIIYDDKSVEI